MYFSIYYSLFKFQSLIPLEYLPILLPIWLQKNYFSMYFLATKSKKLSFFKDYNFWTIFSHTLKFILNVLGYFNYSRFKFHISNPLESLIIHPQIWSLVHVFCFILSHSSFRKISIQDVIFKTFLNKFQPWKKEVIYLIWVILFKSVEVWVKTNLVSSYVMNNQFSIFYLCCDPSVQPPYHKYKNNYLCLWKP